MASLHVPLAQCRGHLRSSPATLTLHEAAEFRAKEERLPAYHITSVLDEVDSRQSAYTWDWCCSLQAGQHPPEDARRPLSSNLSYIAINSFLAHLGTGGCRHGKVIKTEKKKKQGCPPGWTACGCHG